MADPDSDMYGRCVAAAADALRETISQLLGAAMYVEDNDQSLLPLAPVEGLIIAQQFISILVPPAN